MGGARGPLVRSSKALAVARAAHLHIEWGNGCNGCNGVRARGAQLRHQLAVAFRVLAVLRDCCLQLLRQDLDAIVPRRQSQRCGQRREARGVEPVALGVRRE